MFSFILYSWTISSSYKDVGCYGLTLVSLVSEPSSHFHEARLLIIYCIITTINFSNIHAYRYQLRCSINSIKTSQQFSRLFNIYYYIRGLAFNPKLSLVMLPERTQAPIAIQIQLTA